MFGVKYGIQGLGNPASFKNENIDYEYELLAKDQFLKQQVYASLNETAKCQIPKSHD